MLRSDDHFTGNGTDRSALGTQQVILARQFQDQRRDNEAMESYAMPQFQNLIDGNSVYLEMMNRSMNADQYFGGIFPGFGDDRRLNGAEFVGDAIRIAPVELATSSLVEKSTIGGRNLNKRKADCIVEECCNDKEIEESEDTAKSNWETSADNSKVSEIQKPDYIQVRARRGQATDSHSLAERARREKINKKMKCLQDLVPGCSKVTGKAGMLDEIINYVQSLQRQVEFLSMKLAAPNPRLDFDMDSFFMKEFPAHVTGFPAAAAPSDMPNLAYLQLDRAQERAASCGINMPVNPNSSMSIAKEYLDSSCFPESQPLSNWETDLRTLRIE